jgi:8-oxo-dGTP pyrophosphatase MutT (NUDIX family)
MPTRAQANAALRRRLEANLAAFERHGLEAEERRPAAVAATLVAGPGERVSFILTRRAADLSAHSGQWALPGGRIDPGESPEQAALRELHEEVNLEVSTEDILGRLDDYATRSGYVITPVVVWGVDAGPPVADPAEVAAVYVVPVAELDRPDTPLLRSIPESDRPVIALRFRDHLVHAPTAAVLYQLLEVAFHGRATRVAHYDQPVFAWR